MYDANGEYLGPFVSKRTNGLNWPMDLVFGAGGWDDLRMATVDPATLFSPAYTFVYIEGGDGTSSRQ